VSRQHSTPQALPTFFRASDVGVPGAARTNSRRVRSVANKHMHDTAQCTDINSGARNALTQRLSFVRAQTCEHEMTAHVSIPAIEEQQHELVMQMGNQPCSGERRRAKPTHTSLHVSYYKQTHDTKQKAVRDQVSVKSRCALSPWSLPSGVRQVSRWAREVVRCGGSPEREGDQ
jgi:hypothetical protein